MSRAEAQRLVDLAYETDPDDSNHQTPAIETNDLPEPSYRFDIMTFDELMATPDREFLIPGLLGAREIFTIYGGTGEAKTFAQMDILIDAAVGRPIANKHHPVRPIKSIYCTSEGSGSIKARYNASVRSKDLSDAELELLPQNLRIILESPQFTSNGIAQSVDNLALQIRKDNIDVDLIIFDTLRDMMIGTSENEQMGLSIVYDRATRLTQELDVTIGFIHHANKSDTYSGNTTIKAKSDLFIKVSGLDNPRQLEFEKIKDEPLDGVRRGQKWHFNVNRDSTTGGGYVAWLDEKQVYDLNATNDGLIGGKVGQAMASIKTFLATVSMASQAQIKRHVKNSTDGGRMITERALDRLLSDKEISLSNADSGKSSSYWLVTDNRPFVEVKHF